MPGIVNALIIAVIVAAAYFLIRAAMKPDRFRIARAIRIDAPAAAIYPHIAGMERFKAWSPWQDKDPGMTQTMGGPAEGVGSWMEWSGNGKVGQGRMEVVDAQPPSSLRYKLSFLKPMKAENMAEFTLAESGGGTDVTWAMTGDSPFISKLMDAVMNMDKLVGRDFEAGLAKLKQVAERRGVSQA
jgi:uncharacterized protein YndB with AHSA1/START domain